MGKYRVLWVHEEGAPTIVWEWSQGSFPEEVTFKLRPEG